MTIKVIHAADLHLDSPLKGLESYEGAPVDAIRSATRRAFDKLIEYALTERVDLVLLAGDLYDGDWRDYKTGLYFVERLSRLDKAGIPVCLISGNHDAESQITRELRLPSNTTAFDTSKPESQVFDELKIAVHGQGFAQRAVKEDLSKGYPDALSGYINFGLLHTCLDGKPGHAPYAPCTLSGLIAKGYDYWALGHIHKAEVLHENPWIVFSGNIQGRHIRETGEKGFRLISIEDHRITRVEFITSDVFRWDLLKVDITGCEDEDDVIDLCSKAIHRSSEQNSGFGLALRIELSGASSLHHRLGLQHERLESECQSICNQVHGEGVWLQKLKIKTEELTHSMNPSAQSAAVEDLNHYVDELIANSDLLSFFPKEIDTLLTRLPSEVRDDSVADINDPQQAIELLQDARQLLAAELVGDENR